MELMPLTAESKAEWFCNIAGNQSGPVTLEALKAMVSQGQLDASHFVWRPGMEQWAYAGTVAELFPEGSPPPLPYPAVRCGPPVGIWRKGKTLILHRNASLPQRCMKTNSPEAVMVGRNFVWYNRWLLFTLLAGLLVGAIVLAIMQKKASLAIGLTRKYVLRRRLAIAVGWLSLVPLIGGIVVAAIEENPLYALAGLIAFLICVIYAAAASPIIRPVRIDDYYVHLNGCCEEYLATFPQAPAGMCM
ncbi:MAG: DUF4339 domain-containing protein [Planctomycetaceae bacterium]|nr:DUF4339 domain-containing protein [Planctomycetaceae bacterium]